MNPIHIAMVEDDAATRDRFGRAIAQAPDLHMMAQFDNGHDALSWLEHHSPDVLLTDLGLPDIPGLAVLTYCVQRHPRCDTMVITLYDDPTHVVRCLEAGASGYLLKDSLGDEIVQHIRELRAGGSPMTPAIARQVLKRFRAEVPVAPPMADPSPVGNAQPPATAGVLTAKELTVLSRIAQGFRYGEIAELEKISIHTVQSHVKNMYAKLAVHSRTEAVHEAMQLGLIEKGLPRW
jgi:DNA-binding NarL/FixJ family response regulator